MSLQAPYDASYSPPAPVVTITLLSPIDQRLSLTANALLDTGADITVVPDWLPSRFRLVPIGDAFVVGIEGTSQHLVVYDLHLTVGQLSLQNVRVAAAPITEFILGRNVINSLDLRLNGPQLVLEILNA